MFKKKKKKKLTDAEVSSHKLLMHWLFVYNYILSWITERNKLKNVTKNRKNVRRILWLIVSFLYFSVSILIIYHNNSAVFRMETS